MIFPQLPAAISLPGRLFFSSPRLAHSPWALCLPTPMHACTHMGKEAQTCILTQNHSRHQCVREQSVCPCGPGSPSTVLCTDKPSLHMKADTYAVLSGVS